jgi:hypothetical protein
VLNDNFSLSPKPSSTSQLSSWSWSVGICGESEQCMTKNSIGWRIAMNATNGCELRVTATPEFHSLYDSFLHTMRLFSSAHQ